MSVFTPRLTNILTTLIRSETPVSVDRLSGLLGVSRRTIFRDLEGVDRVLLESGLSLETVPGKGICLSGDKENLEKLYLQLSTNKATPQSKRERHTLLALLLMDNDGMQKLFYYARAMGVSEATVSLDMDLLEPKLKEYGLQLKRGRGQGILLSAPEEKIRQGMVSLVMSLEEPQVFIRKYGHPSVHAADGVSRLIREQWEAKLDWMTAGSLRVLELHLLIMVDRVQKGHTLTEQTESVSGLSQKLADQICDSVETAFSIQLSSHERTAVGMLIRTCRAKHWNPLDINDDAVYSYVKRLAFQMIARNRGFTTAIGNCIAIPHGEKEYKQDIIKTGLSVLTYPQGIDWEGEKVHLVIGIAAKGNEHLEILENIVDRLDDSDAVLALVNANDKQAIYDLLTK